MHVGVPNEDVRRHFTKLCAIQKNSYVQRRNVTGPEAVVEGFQTYLVALATNVDALLNT